MGRIAVILSLISLILWAYRPQLHAQATIQGRVTDAQTGKPWPEANVFLSGTKMGTATNDAGYYRLRNIPPGGYRLVVSIIGYEQKVSDVIIGHGASKEINFELEPVVYELPELSVRNLDKEWKEKLERFTDHFVGQKSWADSVKILNPEVLVFDKNWWGRLSAKALAPLNIKNMALGYHITCHLKEFNQSGGQTKWDGEPLFREMKPADSAQAVYWEQNRRKAFLGSMRHFLLALISRQADEEGFILYNHRRGIYGHSSNDRDKISGANIIKEADKDFLYRLNFFGRLEIVYLRENETLEYVQWLPGAYRAPRGRQTSFLELNEHPVTIDADGGIVQPYGVTQFGYFSFERLAFLTSREYRPKDFNQRILRGLPR